MKYLLDTRWLTKKPSGIGWYIYYLIENLAKIDDTDTITLLGGDYKPIKSNFNYLTFNQFQKKLFQGLWKTINWPSLNILSGGQDLVHFTNATAVKHDYPISIVTVHDLSYLTFPESIEEKNLAFLQDTIPWSLNQATHIIAVSEATKSQIIKYFNLPSSKISVIYEGYDEQFSLVPSSQSCLDIVKKYHLPPKFFLSVSILMPRKDYTTQILAYSLLPKDIQDECKLIIIGGTGWRGEEEKIRALIQKLNLQENVRLLGYVENRDIFILHHLAFAYIHSSIEEGFGLPLLQAMAAGLPVIVSNTSCHPETVDEAGLYFEVGNHHDLCSKMVQVFENQDLRNKLISDGKIRVKMFSWEKMARQTLAIYQQLCGK